MSVKIREYKDTDYDACVALSRELAQHHANIYHEPSIVIKDQAKWLDGIIRKNGFVGFWLAEVNKQVVGFCGLFSYGEEGEIEPVVVNSAFRNKSIGSRLIQHVVQEAKDKQIRYLSIRPVARNKEAIALFVRLGFNLLGCVDLFQDLSPKSSRKWEKDLTLFGHNLRY